ncbi:MAG: hypothetical protein ACKVVP_21340 [Chloroflexota bacterium]
MQTPGHAAVILFAPCSQRVSIKDQLGGSARHPLDMDALLNEHPAAFIRAFESISKSGFVLQPSATDIEESHPNGQHVHNEERRAPRADCTKL